MAFIVCRDDTFSVYRDIIDQEQKYRGFVSVVWMIKSDFRVILKTKKEGTMQGKERERRKKHQRACECQRTKREKEKKKKELRGNDLELLIISFFSFTPVQFQINLS